MTPIPDFTLSPLGLQTVLGILSQEAPDGVDRAGWNDAQYDIPTSDGLENAPAYWIERLEQEALVWRTPGSPVRERQNSFVHRSDAYFNARAARLELISDALRQHR